MRPRRHSSRRWPLVAVMLFALLGLVSALTATMGREASAQTLPVISISADAAHFYEGETASFTLTASVAPTTALTVNLSVTEHQTYTGAVPNGQLGAQRFTFPANATTAKYTIAIQNSPNITVDGGDFGTATHGAVYVAVSAGTGYTVGRPQNAGGNVYDVKFTAVDVSISGSGAITEGGTATFTLTASSAPGTLRTVAVQVTDSGNFAKPGQTGRRNMFITAGSTKSLKLTIETVDDSVDEPAGTITVTVLGGTHVTIGSPSTATVAVSDDDEPKPEITVTGVSPITEGANAVFTVAANPAPAANLTVRVAVTQSGDYIAAANVRTHDVVIAANTASKTLTIATIGDSADEANGSVTATINTDSAYTNGSPGAATITVNDDDDPPPAKPTVKVTGTAAITEGANAVFTVAANPAPAANLTVRVAVTQSGDYIAAGNVRTHDVVIAANTASKTLTIATIGDSADEANGWVTASINTHSSYTRGSPSSVRININDDDDPPPAKPTVKVTGTAAITEGANAVFTVAANPAPTANLTVRVAVTQSGSYIAAGDVTTHSVVIAANTASKTLTIATIGDSTDEPNGSVTATVNTHSSYTKGSPGAATITVEDDDDPPPSKPTVKVTGTAAITEGANAVFTVSANPAPTANLTVRVAVIQFGSYISAGDVATHSVVIAANTASKTLTIATINDSTDELNGWVAASINTHSSYTTGSPSSAHITVEDDDGPPPAKPTVKVTGTATITEGANAVFTVSANPAPTANLTVRVAVTQSGDYISAGDVATHSVVIAANTASKTLTITTIGDTTDEPNGWVTASINTHSSYTRGSPSSVRININDDDAPATLSTITVRANSGSIPEGAPANFTVIASPTPAALLTVRLTVTPSGDFARAGQTGMRTVEIPASRSTAQLTVTTVNDSTDEPDGTIAAAISSDNSYRVGTPSSATVAVRDNDVYVPPQPRRDTGSTGSPRRSTTTTTTTTTITTTTTTPGSTDAPADSGSSGSGGDPSPDSPSEGGGQAESDSPAPDPTGPPTVGAAGGEAVTEGQDAVFTITASHAPETDLVITLYVSRDGNFVASRERGTKTTVLPAGQTSVVYRVPTLDGSADEPDGTVFLSIQPGGGYQVGEDSEASVPVSDNDPAPAAPGPAPEPGPAGDAPAEDPGPGGGDLVELIPAALTPDPVDPQPDPVDSQPEQGAVDDEADTPAEDPETSAAPSPDDSGTAVAASSTTGPVSPIVPLAMLAVIAATIVWLFIGSRRRQHAEHLNTVVLRQPVWMDAQAAPVPPRSKGPVVLERPVWMDAQAAPVPPRSKDPQAARPESRGPRSSGRESAD